MTRRHFSDLSVLALGALALGFGAAVAGNPYRITPPPVRLAPAARMTPLDLARRIMARDSALIVLDLRDTASFESFNVPTARNLESGDLRDAALDRYATIVLYADREPEAAQAREELQDRGYADVYVLAGGLDGWARDVLNASLPAGASAAERDAFREVARLSRYFGGTPRINVPIEERSGSDSAARRVRRRGCAL